MSDVPDQAKGPYLDDQDEERPGRPDSAEDGKQMLRCRQLPNNYDLASVNIVIDDKVILQISKQVGSDWARIATALGFPRAEIERISMDFPLSHDRIVCVFSTWMRKQQGTQQTFTILQKALVDAGRPDIAASLGDMISNNSPDVDRNELPRQKVMERQSGPCVPGEENIEESLSGFYHSTKNLRDSDRLGKSKRLPNFAAEYFDSSGGFLDIPRYDVTLVIPKGAIDSGMVQEVYLHVGPQTVYLISEAPTRRPLLGQLVSFGPPGLNFKRHVILHIPLICEKEDDDQRDEVDKDRPATTDWSNIAADEDNDVILKKRQLIMVLSAFPRHCTELKTFKVCVTTPVFNPSDECIQFRVKLWNELHHYHQKGPDEEPANLKVNLESGEVYLTMIDLNSGMKSVSGDGMYISTAKLKENSMNEVSFQLKQTDGSNKHQDTRQNEECLCSIRIRQRGDNETFGSVVLHVYPPKKPTGQDNSPADRPSDDDNSPADSPSDAEHHEEKYQPHLPKPSSEQDQPDLPPDMTKWTIDEVRQWLLYIGIPGVCVSKFVTAETSGDDLAEYSDTDLEENFTLSKNLRELILTSRKSWLNRAGAQSLDCSSRHSGLVSTGSSYMADTDIICNDFIIEPETSTIHSNDDKTDKPSNSIDLSVSVDVIKIPGGEISQRAVQLIVNATKKAVREDSFCDLVTDIGNVFNENYAELVSLEGLTCVVRFRNREGLNTFGEKCASGELAAKLSKILITDKISQVVGSDLEIRLTLREKDYVRGMRHFQGDD